MTRVTPFSGEPEPTASQVEAIVREGHTLIEAGAGSGKTTTLVDKMLFALGADRVPGRRPTRVCELSEIAAITFTNAAAADFKHKLRGRLRLVADFHAGAGNAVEARRWRDRVYAVDRARIGTIHGFCGQMLRDYGIRDGIDPSFAIADESDARRMRIESAVEAVRRALLADREDMFVLAEEIGIRRAGQLVADLVADGGNHEETLKRWATGTQPDYDALRKVADRGRIAWECQGEAGTWRDELDPAAARLGCTLLSLAVEARVLLDRRLDAEGMLDFDALIGRTAALLGKRPDVLRAVRLRLRWLFIDEFQDTDSAQLDIARRICGLEDDGSQASDAPWLCIVGDPKQSIYRFRRADVSLWRRACDELTGRGVSPILLDTNFRSRAPIVDFVNATFDGLIGVAPQAVMATGHEVPYHPLVPHRDAGPRKALVELLPVASEGTADERRAAEAMLVAARIRNLIAGDDSAAASGDVSSRIRYRDCAVLFRARTALPQYEAAFRAAGIPYYVAGGRGLLGRREVRDLRMVLAALDDPHDDVAWVGVLRSPFIGVTDEALMRFRVEHAHAPFSEMPRHLGRSDLAWLDDAAAMRNRVPIVHLLDGLLRGSGYLAALLATPDGEQAVANLRKFSRLAEAVPGCTVAEFIALLDERDEGDAGDADAALFTAGEDVVTLTTIHSAKGLEWPVVFLASLDRSISEGSRQAPIHADPETGIGLAHPTREEGKTTIRPGAYESLCARDRMLQTSEEKRLWYVASTRARDLLVLCAGLPEVQGAAAAREAGTAKRASDWLLRAVRLEGDSLSHGHAPRAWPGALWEPIAREPVATRSVPLPSIEELLTEPEALLPEDRLTRRLSAVPPAAGLVTSSATSLDLLDRDDDPDAPDDVQQSPPRRGVGQGLSTAAIGTVLHAALEGDAQGIALRTVVETRLRRECGAVPSGEGLDLAVTRIVSMVQAARAHPTVRRLAAAEHAERELQFTWFPASANGTAMVRGAIDLAARTATGVELLDFKSHALQPGDEERVADDYAVQRAVYTAAIAALAGVPATSFTFLFPHTGGAVGSSPADTDAELIAALLERARTHSTRPAE